MRVKELLKYLKKQDPEWEVIVTREEETGMLDDYPVLRIEKIWDGNEKISPEVVIFISDLPKG